MELMSPLDSVFLTIESREHPMHVGGLQLFEPPEGAGPEFARELRDALVANRSFQPTFRKHPAWTFGGIPNVAWTYDDPDDVDIDYHGPPPPLPTPGRVRALPTDGKPFSSKNLKECYELAQAQWDRRHDVRTRSTGTWKHGVGMASQIWFGGGGPPSYAWIRVTADGRANVVTAMQDIGTGTRTAMAQIAAEELGLPLDKVEVSLGDTSRGPYATLSAGSSTTPSVGPAVRAAAADAMRQLIEIAAQRYHLEERVLDLRDGNVVSADGNLNTPVAKLVEVLEDAQILGKGARGPNPTGMSVLTFGIHVVEVAVDVETGEIQVERVYAAHDVGRIIKPLGARSQVERGIIQGIGHTLR